MRENTRDPYRGLSYKDHSQLENCRKYDEDYALSAGDVIQRGDLFRADDGRMLEMDNLGRLLGIRVLGQTLKKGGDWFRPSSNTKLTGSLPAKED